MSATRKQRTVAHPASLKGRGLFSGREVALVLKPAEPDTGIVFCRVDLPGRPEARLSPEALTDTDRRTALRVGEGGVSTVEHVLAAVSGLRVDNLLLEMDAEEMPCLDGSALPFVEALRSAGIVAQEAEATILRLDAEIVVEEGDAMLTARPTDGRRFSYTLDYGEEYVGRQTCSFDLTEDIFVAEIAPARTYALRPEVARFQAAGLGGGATEDNVVILEQDGGTSTPLRFPDECCRHKVLDLLGDLAVIGVELHAHIEGVCSGHAQNRALARRIRDARLEALDT